MLRKKLILLCLICPVLMGSVGCNKVDKESLKKNIEISNRKIEAIKKDYDTSKFKATKFYDSILPFICNDESYLELDNMDNDYKESVLVSLQGYKEQILGLYESEKEIRAEKGLEVSSLEDFMKDNIKAYYFLNEQEGTLEQDICFNLPYGMLLGIQVDWLGGEVFGIETYSNN